MTPARARPYSPIQHLAWIAWLNHDPARCFVTTFGAFYDASGSEDDPKGALVVIGLAATEEKWLKCELAWLQVLAKYGVPYFHLKELNNRSDPTSVYAKWKDDDDTPKEFLRDLIQVVKHGTNKTFCYATVLEDFAEVDQVFHLRRGAGSPYVLTAGSCYDLVNIWMKKKHLKDRILHVFEAGDCGQRNLLKLARRLGHAPVTVPKKDPVTQGWYVHFQACDLIAGAYRRAANMRGEVERFEDYGEVFTRLAKRLPQKSQVYNKQVLLDMCKLFPEKYPKRA